MVEAKSNLSCGRVFALLSDFVSRHLYVEQTISLE